MFPTNNSDAHSLALNMWPKLNRFRLGTDSMAVSNNITKERESNREKTLCTHLRGMKWRTFFE